jgi:hypothetical protein
MNWAASRAFFFSDNAVARFRGAAPRQISLRKSSYLSGGQLADLALLAVMEVSTVHTYDPWSRAGVLDVSIMKASGTLQDFATGVVQLRPQRVPPKEYPLVVQQLISISGIAERNH